MPYAYDVVGDDGNRPENMGFCAMRDDCHRPLQQVATYYNLIGNPKTVSVI
ncbi:MAG: hypothetical protein FWC80_04000 [Firmicutes bacterium]|nr:hypothetical protein [Bacillota bacterium]